MSYFGQIKLVDANGNEFIVGKSGELWVRLEGIEEIILELRKINKHLELLNDEDIREEDL